MKLSDLRKRTSIAVASDDLTEELLNFVLEEMDDMEAQKTFIFGHMIIHVVRQGSGDIDVNVGTISHYGTLITKQSDGDFS